MSNLPQKLPIKLRLKSADPAFPRPYYQTAQSSGFDLCANLCYAPSQASKEIRKFDVALFPGATAAVPTGLWVDYIPEGFELQVRPRSGLAKKHGLTVLNTPGTIDADYRGEIVVLLHNAMQFTHDDRKANFNPVFRVEHMMRIAQAVLVPVVRAIIFISKEGEEGWKEVLHPEAKRIGGFGSTGEN